jgi:hypothetical protein
VERFSPRQLGERLTRLRDDLHLAALQYAKEITNSYNYAVDFFIPGKADDRLRDIVEPLFAIAGAAGASDGSQRLTNAMIEVTNKLARIRIAHEADDDAASLIELNALKAIIRTNRRDPVISSKVLWLFFGEPTGWSGSTRRTKHEPFSADLAFAPGFTVSNDRCGLSSRFGTRNSKSLRGQIRLHQRNDGAINVCGGHKRHTFTDKMTPHLQRYETLALPAPPSRAPRSFAVQAVPYGFIKSLIDWIRQSHYARYR